MKRRTVCALAVIYVAFGAACLLADDGLNDAPSKTVRSALDDYGYVSIDEIDPSVDTGSRGAVVTDLSNKAAQIWLLNPIRGHHGFYTLGGKNGRMESITTPSWQTHFHGWVFDLDYPNLPASFPKSVFISTEPIATDPSIYPVALLTDAAGWQHAFPAKREKILFLAAGARSPSYAPAKSGPYRAAHSDD